MSCITPPTIQNPFLWNEVVSNLQNDLATVGWIENIYPIAEVGEIQLSEDDGMILQPMILAQDGTNQFISLLPDETLKALSFFELTNDDITLEFQEDLQTISVSIVVFANLKRIANRTYDFTDELAATIVLALRDGYYSSDIVSLRVIKDKQQVYERYGYSFEQLKQLAYPFTGFKITFEMSINNTLGCVVPGGFDPSYSPSC